MSKTTLPKAKADGTCAAAASRCSWATSLAMNLSPRAHPLAAASDCGGKHFPEFYAALILKRILEDRGAHSGRRGITLAHIGAILSIPIIPRPAEDVNFRTQSHPHDGISGTMSLGLCFSRKSVGPSW